MKHMMPAAFSGQAEASSSNSTQWMWPFPEAQSYRDLQLMCGKWGEFVWAAIESQATKWSECNWASRALAPLWSSDPGAYRLQPAAQTRQPSQLRFLQKAGFSHPQNGEILSLPYFSFWQRHLVLWLFFRIILLGLFVVDSGQWCLWYLQRVCSIFSQWPCWKSSATPRTTQTQRAWFEAVVFTFLGELWDHLTRHWSQHFEPKG